jgi:hypothetical protein
MKPKTDLVPFSLYRVISILKSISNNGVRKPTINQQCLPEYYTNYRYCCGMLPGFQVCEHENR